MIRAWVAAVVVMVAGLVGCSHSSPRVDRVLSEGWRFEKTKGVLAHPGEMTAYGNGERVSVPHTWNAKDGADGGNNYYRGPGLYERSVKVSKEDLTGAVVLRFEAASTAATVYVNMKEVGTHRGGFAAFAYDVTKYLEPGENVVSVMVTNQKDEAIPPLSGDFTVYGGLYRPVHLMVLKGLHVTPLDDGGPGVYVSQKDVSEEGATLDVTTLVRNVTGTNRRPTVRLSLLDAEGNGRVGAAMGVDVPAGLTEPLRQQITLRSPHLWDGVKDPYLYKLVAEVLDEKGEVMDRVEQAVGVRSFTFDKDKGFFLNGRPYSLHGVNKHQDRLGKGWAVSDGDLDEDMAILREVGITVVRCAHYQHPQHWYSLCDQKGVVAWTEIPLVNELRLTEAFEENARQQLRELIKQNMNHPSVCVWGLYNEIGLGYKITDFSMVERLNQYAHELDPTRPTTAAVFVSNNHPLNKVTDVVAFNRYWGWYGEKLSDWPRKLDEIRAAMGGKAVGMSEYGAGASVKQHAVDPSKFLPKGRWHPEEWQNRFHEASYAAMLERPWIWGTFIWVAFDFGVDERDEGDHAGVNDKGLVTGDRKARKDVFYFYKAHWSEEPVLHIAETRFDPRPVGEYVVTVYSNCDEVELWVNGKSLGVKREGSRVFKWLVMFEEGKREVKVKGSRGGKVYTGEHTWVAKRGAATRLTRE